MSTIRRCFEGRCSHLRQQGDTCPVLTSFWARPNEPALLTTDATVIGEAMCVPDRDPFASVAHLEGLWNDVVSTQEFYSGRMRQLFEKMCEKIFAVFGTAVDTWSPFALRRHLQRNVDAEELQSPQCVLGIATFVLGLAARAREYAYVFAVFLLNHHFASSQSFSIQAPAEGEDSAVMAARIRASIAGGCPWAAKVMHFAATVMPARLGELPAPVYARGAPARQALRQHQKDGAQEQETVVQLSRSSFCQCGLPWCDTVTAVDPERSNSTPSPLRCCIINCFMVNGGCASIVVCM